MFNNAIRDTAAHMADVGGFAQAFNRVIGHEGGFQIDTRDRGNWTGGIVGKGLLRGTKWGISAMSYPDEDIQGLTRQDAMKIYKRDWWDKLNLKDYPKVMRFQLFDAAINHGTHNMAVILQTAVGAEPDGVVGPVTLGYIKKLSHDDLVLRFLSCRLEFICQISTFGTYGRGWVRRVAENLRHAAADN